MAYNVTSQNPKPLELVGHFQREFYGITALSGGAATVTIPQGRIIECVWAQAQSSNAVNVTAISTNTFTLAGTGTDAIMWRAVCKGSF